MAGRTTFEKNPFCERSLRQGVMMMEALKVRAEAGARSARALAPVETGAYRDGIQADAAIVPGVGAVARINATDFKSNWIEFGSHPKYGAFPAHAVLRRGAERAGLRVRAGIRA